MRLLCPNCEAQYEVDDAVIPQDGRDVQCSNCGHTWFQEAAGAAPDLQPADPGADSAEIWDDDFDDEDDEPPAAETPAPVAASAPDTAPHDLPAETPSAPVPSPVPSADTSSEPQRRTLDDEVRSVLREEAERETRARIAEGSTLETQTDLGLTIASSAVVVQAPGDPDIFVRDGGKDSPPVQLAEEPESVDALVSRVARRELLPDIEEINSTLRATSERGDEAASRDAPEAMRQRRNGFRRGFVTSLVVMILLLVPYILSNTLSVRYPAVAPALSRYATGIDAIRLWMDQQMQSTTASMRDSSEPSN